MRWTLVVSVPPRPRQFYSVGFPRRIDVVTESQVCNCVPIAPTLEHGIRFLTRLAIGFAKIDVIVCQYSHPGRRETLGKLHDRAFFHARHPGCNRNSSCRLWHSGTKKHSTQCYAA